ncbi:hypothetical protein NQ317_004846 [Molorchus minor]|uniref:Uncharacterized protein n=1 Tax=Molorchus minor TaxID=1323400 RepID=A0ABQ9J318_9CUCU|nr:hypothetical protein NQ317_004846 [Molorchus minor]
MEIQVANNDEFDIKYITMDNDSGYVSHNQESNSDSSMENFTKTAISEPVYISEDALLEKPDIVVQEIFNFQTKKSCNAEIMNNSNSLDSSDLILSSSVISQETTFSGFDNDCSDSDLSVEIPFAKPILVNTAIDGLGTIDANDSSDTNFLIDKSVSCNVPSKKKLTLIFSKCTDENVYSVKRKYNSLSPKKHDSFGESNEIGSTIVNDVGNNRGSNLIRTDADIEGKFEQNTDEPSKTEIEDCDNLARRGITNAENILESTFSPGKFIILKDDISEPKKFDIDVSLVQNNSVLLSVTPKKEFKNSVDPNVSPDLFEEEVQVPINEMPNRNFIAEEKYIIKKDQRILKRVQNALKGVLPPFSVTIVQLSINEMLNRLESNTEYFWTSGCPIQKEADSTEVLNSSNESSVSGGSKSLLITESMQECVNKLWPEVLESRYHGLHFNRSKLSEQFEESCAKYGQRYVGAETQSTCSVFEMNFPSPVKRKQLKQRWPAKSPGRRLSHLARRRITFSSANLQAGLSAAGSRARQILVDAKKLDSLRRNRSPRKSPRKTPRKSPRIKSRTPSTSGTSNLKNDLKTQILRDHYFHPQRSPFRCFQLEAEKKRKRNEWDDIHVSKVSKTAASDIRPSQSELKAKFSKTTVTSVSLSSSISQSGELSALHKKKLQWAVYEALRSQNIMPIHPQFKMFASVLARVTRRFLLNLSSNGPRPDGGTSERMLRITRHHVYAVVKGKTVDEIINDYLKNRTKAVRPQGYVGIQEFNDKNKEAANDKENAISSKINSVASLEKKNWNSYPIPV